MESVRQGERQLLPGRQMVDRSWVSYTAVAGDPEVIQEVDVLVLFITCSDKRIFALGTTNVRMHKYYFSIYAVKGYYEELMRRGDYSYNILRGRHLLRLATGRIDDNIIIFIMQFERLI